MFYGLNSAVKGLLASQRALYTTNHNVDNANTKGYSRQQIDQRATSAFRMPGIGFLGTGTEVYNVARIRDSFLDYKYWNEAAPMGEWQIKRESLVEIEKLMAEPSDKSFRQYLDDFYTSLEDMSTNPSDVSYREPVRENAKAFVKHINETAQRLENIKKETEYSIDIKVKHANKLADQIAGLNRQIYSQELDGHTANDLRDRRELLVDELSTLFNVRVNESTDGKYNVSIDGISIVDHIYTNEMRFKSDHPDGPKILWGNGGEVTAKSGEVKGLMDMFTGDGQDNTYRGIPFYIDQLNAFAKGFATKFNEQHEKGFTSDGRTGIDFFEFDADNAAFTIRLSDEILDDINNIAAAGSPDGDNEDNANLLALIGLRENKKFFEGIIDVQGTPDDFLKSILSSMAVDSLQANRLYKTQELIQQNIDTKRESVSGVNLDEEMSDMVRFQHVYVASAKMISTMDMLIDITVNRLGLVGR